MDEGNQSGESVDVPVLEYILEDVQNEQVSDQNVNDVGDIMDGDGSDGFDFTEIGENDNEEIYSDNYYLQKWNVQSDLHGEKAY